MDTATEIQERGILLDDAPSYYGSASFYARLPKEFIASGYSLPRSPGDLPWLISGKLLKERCQRTGSVICGPEAEPAYASVKLLHFSQVTPIGYAEWLAAAGITEIPGVYYAPSRAPAHVFRHNQAELSETQTNAPVETAELSETHTQAPLATAELSETHTQAPVETAELSETHTQAPVETAELSETQTQAPVETAELSETQTQAPVETAEPSETRDLTPVEAADPLPKRRAGRQSSAPDIQAAIKSLWENGEYPRGQNRKAQSRIVGKQLRNLFPNRYFHNEYLGHLTIYLQILKFEREMNLIGDHKED